MKNYSIIFFLFLASLSSCRNEFVELETGLTSTNIYLPTKMGNFWTYKVLGGLSARDSLYVLQDVTINGIINKKFKTKFQPVGLFSSILNDNAIRKSADKILISGKINLNFIPNTPVNLDITDFVLFKELTSPNEELDSKSGVIEQTVSGNLIKIEYKLRTIGLPPLSAFTTSEGKTYADVKPVRLILNAKITASTPTIIGIPLNIPILNSQDVITATQYYSKNKGMVYAKTVFSYQLQTLPLGFNVGFPTSRNETQEEFLDKFLAAN